MSILKRDKKKVKNDYYLLIKEKMILHQIDKIDKNLER